MACSMSRPESSSIPAPDTSRCWFEALPGTSASRRRRRARRSGAHVGLKREIKRSHLYPGDVLILITDGLVEGVNRDIDEALDQIAKTLTEADPSPVAMLDELFGMNEETAIDDAAALLITWSLTLVGDLNPSSSSTARSSTARRVSRVG